MAGGVADKERASVKRRELSSDPRCGNARRRGDGPVPRYDRPVILSAADARRLTNAALSAGFERAGLAPLAALADAGLRAWLADGRHAGMKYLERFLPLREDPRRAFPKYRSVLVVAADYGDDRSAPPPPDRGDVARYARGDDYHLVLKARLRALQGALRAEFPAVVTRPFVDSGPLNEKLAAAVAGLGWVGRNTNLVNRRAGSWCVLGLLLLSADVVAAASPAKDYCGLCTRCLEVCPTGAIVAPYELDARLCISYLTIEHAGPIPRALRPAVGNRIFGCDDCQAVCPWNRFATRSPSEPFRPRDDLHGRPLTEWLSLDAASFATTFAGAAILRAGAEGFARNVLVAAGNAFAAGAGDADLDRAVERRLADPSPVVRDAAAWALGRRRDGRATRALKERREVETNEAVRLEIDASLAEKSERR